MAEGMLVSTVSKSGPLPGQSARSSDNFITAHAPSATTHFRVEVDSSLEPNNISNIVFDIAEDKSGSDSTIYNDVRNGYTLPVQRKNSLYIIARGGTSKPFRVKLYYVT